MTMEKDQEKDQDHTTGKILNLTLEIIYLLTREIYPFVKCGDQKTTMVPQSLTPQRNNVKKILELTTKITYLLSGESGDTIIKVEENRVMEDLSEAHKGIIESPNTTNPPEKCHHPLYSGDSTAEDLIILHHDQSEDLMNLKVEDEVEEAYVRDDQQCTEETEMRRSLIEEDTPTHNSTGYTMEEPSKDCLTLSQDCKMEDEDFIRYCSGEKTMTSAMDGGHPSMDRPWNTSHYKPSRTVTSATHGGYHSKDRQWNSSENDPPHTLTSAMDGGLHSVNRHWDLADYVLPHTLREGAGIQEKETISVSEFGERFSSPQSLSIHQRSHTKNKPYSCSECGKCFAHKSELIRHKRTHTGEKPFSCPECDKSFSRKHHLEAHHRSHTGEKPFFCDLCGKRFSRTHHLNAHQRSHTGEKPYSCSECRKCFATKSNLSSHLRCHTGEKPFSCAMCGNTFGRRKQLFAHYRWHKTKIID